MQHGVTVTEISIERGKCRKLASDGVVGQALPYELVAPGDHIGAGHVAELGRLPQACEGHEVGDVLPVGAARVGVREVGKPLDLRRHVRQGEKLSWGKSGQRHKRRGHYLRRSTWHRTSPHSGVARSKARNASGVMMVMPSYCCKTSKSLSRVTRYCTAAARTQASTISSSG